MAGTGEAATADVYAGDNAVPQEPSGTSFAYTIAADADPDAVLRALMQVRLGNVAPSAGTFATRNDGVVVMRIEVRGLTLEAADSIRRKLLQLSTVRTVELEAAAGHAAPCGAP